MDEPVKITLQGESLEKFKRHLDDRLRSLIDGLKELHEEKLPRWRKMYEAQPLEKVRESPFHNASNLVVPIIAIHSNTLLARIMSAMFKTLPLWLARVVGSGGANVEQVDQIRIAFEEYMSYIGVEPMELDLYRVSEDFYGDVIQYGTSVIKSPWQVLYEDRMIPSGDGMRGSREDRKLVYEGPRPEKIAFEDFGVRPNAKTLETADFKYHRIRLQRHELEERRASRVYDPTAVTEVLKMPDRSSPIRSQQDVESDSGAKTVTGYGFAEWDIYECWYIHRVGSKRFRVTVWYHLLTRTILRAIYSNYPSEPFVGARLFLRKDSWYGYGFCEMLGMGQEEVSTQHNQRQDAKTVANASFARVDPDSKLHDGYLIFPGATVPGVKDEIEMMRFGEPSAMSIDDERLSLELMERLSGVSPPMQGYGAGTTTKRGVYSAMGTLSLLQEGSSRTDLNIMDMRYAHTKLGRLISEQIAAMGNTEERYKRFGSKAQLIMQAFRAIQTQQLCLPIVASNASINREVEKQNDLLLSNILSRHYQQIAQMLHGVASGMLKPEEQEYVVKSIKAANALMTEVMRHFGYDEPERYVPEVSMQQPQQPPGGPVGQPGPGQQQGPGGQQPAQGGPPGAGAPQQILPAIAALAQRTGNGNLLQMGGVPVGSGPVGP